MRLTMILPATLLAVLTPLSAQNYKDLHDTIDNFRGLGEEVRKNHPLLGMGSGVGTYGGSGSILEGLGLTKKAAPVKLELRLSKEQQALVDREMAKAVKAEAAANKGVAAGSAAAGSAPAPSAKAKPRAGARAGVVPAADRTSVPVQLSPVVLPAVAVAALPEKPEARKVKEESVRDVAEGMDRERLLASLGEPQSVSAITGLEGGTRETLTYELESGRTLVVKLVAGKVQSVQR